MNHPGFQSYTTFSLLGGGLVDERTLVEEASRLPLREALAYLSSLSKRFYEIPQGGQPSFISPLRQGEFLNYAIVDDFPVVLPGASKMYSPGRVPYTQGKGNVFIHSHNISYLSHTILQKCVAEKRKFELDYELPRRICRLLLIVNDYLCDPNKPQGNSNSWGLIKRRDWIDGWIRLFQYNKCQQWHSVFVLLGRYKRLYLGCLPTYFPELQKTFAQASGGVSIERYFSVIIQLLAHTFWGVSPVKLFWNRSSLFSQIKETEQVHFNKILDRWVLQPEMYNSLAEKQVLPFDYAILRAKPFVEVAKGELICPNYEYLIDKIIDEPFYILVDYLKGDRRFDVFRTVFGQAYEEYVNSLIAEIAKKDPKGEWYIECNPKNANSEELADVVLQRGSTLICFEHKAKRLPIDFLAGGSGEKRVVGPNEIYLKDESREQLKDHKKMAKEDKSLVTQGLWQQNIHLKKLIKYVEDKRKVKIETVYPLITMLAEIRVDDVVYIMYLKPLIDAAGLYTEKNVRLPQFLHIMDLEALERGARKGKVDFEQMLVGKHGKGNFYKRFDIFLHENHLNFMPDLDESIKLMEQALKDYNNPTADS